MAEWLRQTIGTGPLAGMFYRNGAIVHCPRVGQDGYIPPTAEHDHNGPSQVRPLTDRTLASHIQYAYWCVRKEDDDEDKDKPPTDAMFPKDAARVAVDVPDQLSYLRPLRGVIHSPIVRRNGSVLGTPGYDDETGLVYLPEPSLVIPHIPEESTPQQVEEAVQELDYMVCGFDFLSKSDRANYFGLLLTPLLRELAPPPYKLGAIGAPQPGSGKTLLATIMRIIHGGVFRSEMPDEEAELKKNISTILDITTGPVIHIDNVSGVFRSSTFAGLLTSSTWEDRRLGTNQQITAPNDRLWVITGNNLSLGGDLVRRTLWVTIDPACPDPHLRTGFAIRDLEGWARQNRARLLGALLTLIRAWVAAGQPINRTGSDSYAHWIAVVDGILSVAGIEGTFDDREAARQTVGSDDDGWREFLEAVHTAFGEQVWTVKELLYKVDDGQHHIQGSARASYMAAHPIPLDALPTELIEKVSRSALGLSAISKSLGKWLHNRDGRWAGRITVRSAGKGRTNIALWKIQDLGGHGE